MTFDQRACMQNDMKGHKTLTDEYLCMGRVRKKNALSIGTLSNYIFHWKIVICLKRFAHTPFERRK